MVGVHRTRFAKKAQEVEVQERPQPQCLPLEDGVVVTAEHVLLVVDARQQRVEVGYGVVDFVPNGIHVAQFQRFHVIRTIFVKIISCTVTVISKSVRGSPTHQFEHVPGQVFAVQVIVGHVAIHAAHGIGKSRLVLEEVVAVHFGVRLHVQPVVARTTEQAAAQHRQYQFYHIFVHNSFI